ncbi:hypothetical protein EV643_104185 [Kribbella sp. VKM Ac-2527]|uniref:Uncharacterized protein n=1 Tax=Kribbella caucasensis TaxID=2512215 RepID=A0A4R6KJN8_9ACTN|nr:DUF5682 family protein [Kribbella sp. VKM Ac-2527]TDO50692.1 hypothetical protein EV643_104185 [Kribbella sp. VKM Ac-2527]
MTVHLFGIRHHGPGSARALAVALDELRPDIVLIEGPPEADKIVALAGDPDMVPPVALLAYAVDDSTKAAFWPFAVFSPEWQAIRHALSAGVPVRFCDLPAAFQFGSRGDGRGLATDPLATLAAAGGYDDPERWWDDVIEHRRDGAEPFTVIAEAMGELRRDEVPSGREAQREAYMRTVLRKAIKEGFERIAVVCGAWHVPALTIPLPPATHDQRILKGLAKRKVACTWVPWTHGRLASSSGYGAGVTSPGWYHHLFTTPDQVTTRWLTKVAQVLRAEDLPVSSAHVIEAVRLADTLAALRERPLAGLSEVTEATRAVMCGGNEVLLDLVTREAVVGELLGAVPSDTPQAPVAADLAAQARRLRLKRDAVERVIDLDLRKPNDLEKSHLLHRLRILGIDWGLPTSDERRSQGTFREMWKLTWDPGLEVDLVAAGAHGTTVAGAATSVMLGVAAESANLAEVTAALERSLLAELADALPELLAGVDTRAAKDTDVGHLMEALPALARSARYGDVRGSDTAGLASVAERMVSRVCVGLARFVHGLDPEAAAGVLQLVDGVQDATTLLSSGVRDEWLRTLQGLSDRSSVPPLIAGRLTRLMLDTSRIEAGEVALRLGRALSPGTPTSDAAGYVEGFLAGGGLLLVHDERLLALVDSWLAAIPDEAFLEVLPLLRRTFGTFASPERRSIGERARALGNGVQVVAEDNELDDELAASVLPVVAQLLGV